MRESVIPVVPMQTAFHLAGISLAVLGLIGCATEILPPPAAPAREIPKGVEPRRLPAEEGTTRVLLDADGTRAKVLDIVDQTEVAATVHNAAGTGFAVGHAETSKPICITPCYADLKPGAHVLRFTETDGPRWGNVDVQVNDTPKAVRHAFGEGTTTHGSQGAALALLVVGSLAAAVGVALLPVALLDKKDNESQSGYLVPALVTFGAGAGAALLSIPIFRLSRNTYQSGSTTEFPLER